VYTLGHVHIPPQIKEYFGRCGLMAKGIEKVEEGISRAAIEAVKIVNLYQVGTRIKIKLC